MPSHALLAPVKREDTTTRGSDDADVRATTAMAIVELLASGSAKRETSAASSSSFQPYATRNGSSFSVPAQACFSSLMSCSTSSPSFSSSSSSSSSSTSVAGSEDTKDAGAGSAASCSSWCASNASKCTLGAFPGLASLLPLKRPLWKTDAATAAPGGDAHKPTPVHIQPLPSIAQLSKLAISSVERMSPTGIDVVAANGSAMETASSPALTPIVPPRFSAVTSANSTPVTPAPSVNHSRKRQKDELDRLRVQVQELQRELEHVRGRIPKKPQMLALDGAGGGSDMHGLLPSSVTVWERIASHQKEQKNRSEMENMKLKAMVHEQVKISKALEKLVNKRCKNSQSLESKFAAKRLRVSEANEAQIYEMLSRDIGERYKHVDAALEELGMAAQKRELQEAQMILDTTNGPMMELKDATIFPFDVDAISDAAWRSMELESIGFNDNVGLVESVIVHSSEDTICMQTTAPIRHPRTNNEAELRIRAVIKRFVERHRVVVLWESVSEGLGKLPCLASASGAPSVEMRDRGLCLIEALPSAPGRHSTIIQLCSRLAPLVAGSEGGSSPHLPLQHMHGIVDSVAPCYRHIWGNRQQVMENILMENVVGLPRPGVVVGEPGSRSPKDEKMHLASHCGGASSSS